MTRAFRITTRAHEDFKSIGRFTLLMCKRNKRNSYLHDLGKRFAWLAQNPKLGNHRSDIEDGYDCYLQGAHLIFLYNQQGH
ncbi:type II toxin-antitoxin system RelE/ParE family toxin [Nitrosomonas supralitoralis]|uniref:Type II toxin-antitoxin system RelE/ParE family toxin n=1 Tax=Nitrosomonas supralitoralis TaxID=2116706 RepID=A0A2P7NRQ8_9PROT|nr:type II toxin-antitoxin system RelE/ParE family toxin [Nitrosomonas supralitoralis]PSJ16171.1 type II toxin-antitoxin system RelE/ParE family toxin [Nitrosomonas supralitoralis]